MSKADYSAFCICSVVGILLFIGGFFVARHRYDGQVKTITQEKIVDHTVTKIVKIKNKDGSEQETTVIDDTRKQTASVVVKNTAKTNISFIVSNDFSHSIITPIYGVSVNREILGPFTIGAFALQNSVAGLSIGINF